MKRPSSIDIGNYDYELPQARIADYPLEQRDSSKLLVYKDSTIRSDTFKNLPEHLREDQLLVFNNTRVIQARLIFRKESGAVIEIFLLEPENPSDHQLAFGSRQQVEFRCLVGNAKKWKQGEVYLEKNDLKVSAQLMGRSITDFTIRFSWNRSDLTFAELIEMAGSTPIPPYLNREAEKSDIGNYQTVYARHDGSVAAPTAGLHFTGNVIEQLNQKGINSSELILHVGAGTFIPVKHDNALNHEMHGEVVSVNRSLIEQLLTTEEVIAVGTTTARSLESLYWLGAKLKQEKDPILDNLFLGQWDAYDLDGGISLKESLDTIMGFMSLRNTESIVFRTHIMITPGYSFRVIRGLITNFHQPRSTLLLLISALVGDRWREIYNHAMENDFRFLSYGDSSLLIP